MNYDKWKKEDEDLLQEFVDNWHNYVIDGSDKNSSYYKRYLEIKEILIQDMEWAWDH